jgi:hypothetical protein
MTAMRVRFPRPALLLLAILSATLGPCSSGEAGERMAASKGGGVATGGSINSGATPALAPILGAIEAHNLATYGSAQAPFLPGLTPQQFEDAEYTGSGVLGLINAAPAYARGATGADLSAQVLTANPTWQNRNIIAVLDSGLDQSLPQYQGRTVAGANFTINPNSPTTDTTPGATEFGDHGPEVTGIAAAPRDGSAMQGVAYNAKVMPLRIFDDNGNSPTDAAGAAFNWAVAHGASVLNNSWTTSIPVTSATASKIPLIDGANFLPAVEAAVAAHKVIVFAAGNSANRQPDLEPGLPYLVPQFQPNWIAVVALNASGTQLASFSNQCGVAMSWCLAAPGVNLTSLNHAGQTVTGLSGTSFAAPAVSGAVAVLLQYFPYLTPEQVVEVLLRTADPLGGPGVDAVFGHGRLDLGAATNPIGEPTIQGLAQASVTASGGARLSQTALLASAAFGNGLSQALARAPALVVFDAYGRAYAVPLPALVRPAPSLFDSDKAMGRFAVAPQATIIGLGRGLSLSVTNQPADDRPLSLNGISSVALRFETGGTLVGLHLNDRPRNLEGVPSLAGMADTSALIDAQSLDHPFLGLADTADAVAWQTRLGASLRAGLVALTGATGAPPPLEPIAASELGLTAGPEDQPGRLFGSAATLRYGHPDGSGVQLDAALGSVVETGTVLGAYGTGAFATNNGATTTFGSLALRVPLTSTLALVGDAHLGDTRVTTSGADLVRSTDAMTSAFNFGASADAVLTERGRLTFVIGQPLRVESGRLNIDMPIGRTFDGDVLRSRFTSDAAPSGREIDARAAWATPLDDRSSLAVGVMERFDPDHIDGARPQTIAMVRYDHRF